jgi:hypothetical protein
MSGAAAARPARDAGSVLVEAMTSIAVVALVLGAGYVAVGDSALRAQAADRSRMAMLVARSEMAAVGAEVPLTPGDADGVEGDFRWRTSIVEEAAPASATGRLLRVTVTVSDREHAAERARLVTLRLVPGGGA